jgi:hypothetical protein
LFAVALLLAAPLIAGCSHRLPPPEVATTQPATQPSTMPATVEASTLPAEAPVPPENIVTAPDFDHLWNVCADVARDRHFVIDRRDYRGGVLTTEPLVSAQFFEPWRRDALTAEAVAESSLATIRRIIRFEFTRNDDDTYSVVPHVFVERYSVAERRITSAMAYRSAFRRSTAVGTRERDRGIELPQRYWYRIGNDPVLEAHLAREVRHKL